MFPLHASEVPVVAVHVDPKADTTTCSQAGKALKIVYDSVKPARDPFTRAINIKNFITSTKEHNEVLVDPKAISKRNLFNSFVSCLTTKTPYYI